MAARSLLQAKGGRPAVAALLLLCLLLALGAMRSDLFPDSVSNLLPPMEREALPFALLAAAAASFALLRKMKWLGGRQRWSSIAIGLGLFVLPAVLVSLSQSRVSSFTRVVLFSLTPVFAVVFEPYVGGAAVEAKGGLLAALVAVGGTLCVFPVEVPGSIEAGGAFAGVIAAAACVAAANCYAVRLATTLPRTALPPITAIACASAALGLATASALTDGIVLRWSAVRSEFLWSALLAFPGLLLLFWLLPRMTAPRMTTRFLLSPLIAILIGMALDRPSVGLRTWAGLLLIAAGAGWLLFVPGEEPNPEPSSLSLHR
jgi:drug/metabolite transporter (DMT)-like permease